MRDYPQFSFWISIALAKICFSRIVINRAPEVFLKNTSVLVGTVLNAFARVLCVTHILRSNSLFLCEFVQGSALYTSNNCKADLTV